MRRAPFRWVLFLVVNVPAIVSCSLLVDWNEFNDQPFATSESGADGGGLAADGDGLADPARDAGGPTDGDVPESSTPPCSSDAGPTLVPVGASGFCIDSTEVTVADYRAFVLAREGDTSGQRADCTANTTFAPTEYQMPMSDDRLPMRFVDFCDAVAFCEWAGKRLCGAIDGGSVSVDDVTNASVDQWHRACSRNNDGLHAYPYGPSFDNTACNAYAFDAGGMPRGALPVASLPRCEGAYSGIFDLSGNLDEWEDSCTSSDAGRSCVFRGGSYNAGFGKNCGVAGTTDSTLRSPSVGFRCCSR